MLDGPPALDPRHCDSYAVTFLDGPHGEPVAALGIGDLGQLPVAYVQLCPEVARTMALQLQGAARVMEEWAAT